MQTHIHAYMHAYMHTSMPTPLHSRMQCHAYKWSLVNTIQVVARSGPGKALSSLASAAAGKFFK